LCEHFQTPPHTPPKKTKKNLAVRRQYRFSVLTVFFIGRPRLRPSSTIAIGSRASSPQSIQAPQEQAGIAGCPISSGASFDGHFRWSQHLLRRALKRFSCSVAGVSNAGCGA
jgi:hypothetical protein